MHCSDCTRQILWDLESNDERFASLRNIRQWLNNLSWTEGRDHKCELKTMFCLHQQKLVQCSTA